MIELTGRATQFVGRLYDYLKSALGGIGASQLVIAAFFTAFTLDVVDANPLADIHIDSFNRQIGQATVADWDVGVLISHFLALYLVAIPLLFVVFLAVVTMAAKGISTKGDDGTSCSVVRLATFVSGYGLVAFLLRCASLMAVSSSEGSGVATTGVMVDPLSICAAGVGLALFWCAMVTHRPEIAKAIGGDTVEWSLALGLALTLPLHLLAIKVLADLPLWLVFLSISLTAMGAAGLVSQKVSTEALSMIQAASIPFFLSTFLMRRYVHRGWLYRGMGSPAC